jgi:hypothetical protein
MTDGLRVYPSAGDLLTAAEQRLAGRTVSAAVAAGAADAAVAAGPLIPLIPLKPPTAVPPDVHAPGAS